MTQSLSLLDELEQLITNSSYGWNNLQAVEAARRLNGIEGPGQANSSPAVDRAGVIRPRHPPIRHDLPHLDPLDAG